MIYRIDSRVRYKGIVESLHGMEGTVVDYDWIGSTENLLYRVIFDMHIPEQAIYWADRVVEVWDFEIEKAE